MWALRWVIRSIGAGDQVKEVGYSRWKGSHTYGHVRWEGVVFMELQKWGWVLHRRDSNLGVMQFSLILHGGWIWARCRQRDELKCCSRGLWMIRQGHGHRQVLCKNTARPHPGRGPVGSYGMGIVPCAWETRSQLYCWSDRLTSQYDSRICFEKQILTQAYFLRKCKQHTACLKSSHACFIVQYMLISYRTIEWLHWISVFFIVLSIYKNYFLFFQLTFSVCAIHSKISIFVGLVIFFLVLIFIYLVAACELLPVACGLYIPD